MQKEYILYMHIAGSTEPQKLAASSVTDMGNNSHFENVAKEKKVIIHNSNLYQEQDNVIVKRTSYPSLNYSILDGIGDNLK